MDSIKKFKGTKHYLMNNGYIEEEIDSNGNGSISKKHGKSTLRDEAVNNVSKRQKFSSSDLMGRLELFSNIWNDCPEIVNPKEGFKNGKNEKNNYGRTNDEQTMERNIFTSNTIFPHNNESLKSSNVEQLNVSSSKNKIQFHKGISRSNKADDEKRLKAVEEQRKLHVKKQNIIKQALSSLDSGQNHRINKKIIFNDESKPLESHKTEESDLSERRQLFEKGESDNENELKINSQFEGKKGQKLLALQSKYSSDSRFALDKRFAESGSESEIESPENGVDEKRKQYEILESIVGRPLKPSLEIKKSTKTPQTLLLRFDPLREDHSQYIVKPPEEKELAERKPCQLKKKEKENKKKTERGAAIQEENRPEVPVERFYEVKDNLKETFKKETGQEFSLLKLFGSKDSDKQDSRPEKSQPVKKKKHKTKSPFKYDSSDSEIEEKETKDSNCNIQSNNDKREPRNISISWHSSFFFTEDDPRFKEALEFLKVPETKEDESVYAETRKTLKDFLKRRYKNNLKNKGVFKKKLGGGKQGSVCGFKKRNKS